MTSKEPGCTGARALGVYQQASKLASFLFLSAGLLAFGGGAAWAVSNPSTCTKTGPALLLTELRDLAPVDGVGETPITGSKVDGETIYYQASLFVSTATGQCAYFGGTICIDTPGASGCVDVTPVGGIPLLCDNDAACNPDGVPSVDSKQISYVVNHLDFDNTGLCDNQVRAVAQYHNGTSQFNQGVFPVNADTPICNPVLFCGDGISGNTNGETCDPPGAPGGANGNTCRANCTVCGDGHLDAGEQCDDGNTNNADACRNTCELPVCGDGVIGNTPGETCDPPGSPAGAHNNPCRGDCTVCGDGTVNDGEQCDDGNTVDTDGCRNTCLLPICGDSIVGNTPGETCDPPGSPAGANNNPCRGNCTVCGDSVVDTGEQCDDGNTVDTDGCRNTCLLPVCGDSIVGNTPGETCDPPGSPAGANNNPCRGNCTVCGDSVVDAGEQCDDGNTNNTDGCLNSCLLPVCGDGIIGNTPGETCDPPGTPAGVHNTPCRGDCTVCGDSIVNDGEQCDDGNTVDTDGCRNNCQLPICGDSVVGNTPGETCDPPGAPSGAHDNPCRANCTVCGDSVVDTGEECDDGNVVDADGCRNNCLLPVCGDSIVGNTPGETCDPPGSPAGANNNPCRANCTVCGDGNVDTGEACDDGNTVDTDGCRNSCMLPGCGDGIVGNTPGETCDPPGSPAGSHNNPCRADCTVCGDGTVNDGEACDDGNTSNTDTCRNNCTIPRCGDGIVDAGEACDDGNTSNTDSCRNDCTIPRCGDGIVDAGEACDDGNTSNTDSCRNDCTVPRCGDGIVDSGEECDDGNTNNTDGCANNCTIPRCGDSILGNTPGETCDPPGSVPVPGDGDNECRADCTFCGDNVLDAGEGCDDGNQTDGDGCSSVCIPEQTAICRTPGFWGTHAYANPKKKNSQNITQAVIDAGGGCLNVCGEVIEDTLKNSADSAIEAICISIKGDSRLQLARQLTAAALNCVISGGGADCAGTPSYASVYSTCNSLCANSASSNSAVTSCIGQLDCLNNGGIPLSNGQCQKGVCSGNHEPCNGSCSDGSVCGPIPGNCHERILVNEDLGLDFDPPGPAGSEGLCSDANGNACKVLQPGESKCGSGNTSPAPEVCQ